jgi:hypothetical protein
VLVNSYTTLCSISFAEIPVHFFAVINFAAFSARKKVNKEAYATKTYSVKRLEKMAIKFLVERSESLLILFYIDF